MKIVIVSRGYPSDERLYNHGFVHRRVLAYRALGHEVTVIWRHHRPPLDRYTFEGVEVLMRTPADALELIRQQRPDAVALHAPADDFADLIENVDPSIPVNGWIYGAEIMPFYEVTERADHNRERWDKARAVFERRMEYWRRLVENWPSNFRLVFVSQFSASEAERVVGQTIPRKTISPSPVDVDLFAYIPKPLEQRFKVLLVRPFSDWRYANDKAVEAILQLSKDPQFDRFAFRIMGEGHLFEELTRPLTGFANVTLEQRFVTQQEMTQLHREHGIFLCPSRNDAQGVSRDEAMSSGLVPVTNAVGAVPEFADSSCGWLAPAEDAGELARGLKTLADDPEEFARVSEAAANRVRSTLAMDQVVERELRLMQE